MIELGDGKFRLSEEPEVVLPKEAEFIIRIFWKEPESCKVFYDRQKDCILIVPEKRHISEMEITMIRLKLHEAIALVIDANNNKPMKPTEILEKIKHYDLYRKKDGNYPSIQQIHARISNYPEYFKRTDEGVILTEDGIKLAQKIKSEGLIIFFKDGVGFS